MLLNIWDTAGMERFRALMPTYYRSAVAAVVVYDITDPSSFKAAQEWIKEVRLHALPGVVLMLVGNKKDLQAARKVDADEAARFAESNGLLFTESSAKTNENVTVIFETLANAIPMQLLQGLRNKKQNAFEIEPLSPHRRRCNC